MTDRERIRYILTVAMNSRKETLRKSKLAVKHSGKFASGSDRMNQWELEEDIRVIQNYLNIM